MRSIRVYADTSVFGGVLDDEFSEASRRFFEGVAKGRYVLLTSQAVVDELGGAPEKVREVLRKAPAEGLEMLDVTDEARELAEAYIEAGAVGRASGEDALHIAVATVAGADLILSWNFRHIVNFDRIRRFNAVNMRHGWRQVEIRSPLEVGDEE